MRVLIIDNNIDPDSWGSSDLRRMVRAHAGATLFVRRAPHEDLPLSPLGFDRVVISGSKTSALDDAPWISSLHEFIRSTIHEGIPLLGVCYGHQSLIRALGGKQCVRQAQQAEFGWTKIEILETNPLLQGLGPAFYSFSSHFDEAGTLPEGVKRIARSEACEIQACQVLNRPVFGIQFHPEKDLKGANQTLSYRKKVGAPKQLLHPEQGPELYDPKVGETIFRNFLNL